MPRLSFIVQIAIYSLFPLAGLLFFGWDWRQILILFWLENITVGIKTVIGMARTNSSPSAVTSPEGGEQTGPINQVAKLGSIVFFVVHYGMFTFVHGIFVFALVSGVFLTEVSQQSSAPVDMVMVYVLWTIVSLVQIVSLFKQPAPTSSIAQQFSSPYSRIVPLHIAVILGAFAIVLFNLPTGVAIVLIVMKLIFDIIGYKAAPDSTLRSDVLQ